MASPPFFRPGQKDGGGLADRTHDAVAAGHEEGGEKEPDIIIHKSKAEVAKERAGGAAR